MSSCTYRLACFSLCSSAGSVGTSVASPSSHSSNALLYYLPSSLFRLCPIDSGPYVSVHSGTRSKKLNSSSFYKDLFLFSFFGYVFVGLFLYVRECCRESAASTAQRTAMESTLHKAAKQVRAGQIATTQASRQNWREPACRRAFIQLVVLSKRTKKSKRARPTER